MKRLMLPLIRARIFLPPRPEIAPVAEQLLECKHADTGHTICYVIMSTGTAGLLDGILAASRCAPLQSGELLHHPIAVEQVNCPRVYERQKRGVQLGTVKLAHLIIDAEFPK
jgi:hypothetical protein